MNIEQIHLPQRLQGENSAEYAARRRMSKRLQQRTTLVYSVAKAPSYVNRTRADRRALFKAVGHRQAIRAIRRARADARAA